MRSCLFLTCILLVLGCDFAGDDKTKVTVTGRVASADGQPIFQAAVTLLKMEWSTDQQLVAVRTTAAGYYTLTYTFDYCPESLLKIRAAKDGYMAEEWTKLGHAVGGDPGYVHCTEESQTIDFSLASSSK